MRAGSTVRREGLLPPPVGTSDWARFSRDSYCVDKTLILKDLIDSKSRVVLFTRPRRFGKTTMLEMVRAFYEGEESLFHDKKIWAAGEAYRKEQGSHPVIFLSFKDIKQATAADSEKDDLKSLARDARAQIDGKKYDTTFRAEGITDIEKIGLAYFKDKVELCKELPK